MNSSMTSPKTTVKTALNKHEEQMKARMRQILESDYTYAETLNLVQNEIEESNRMTNLNYRFLCFKNDGIYQLNEAIREIFGSVTSYEDKGPSAGETVVNTVDVTLADGTRLKCPYGDITLPALGEDAMITINYDTKKHQLLVTGKCQKRFSSMVDNIIDRTQERLNTCSIYKNQALEITDINNPTILNLSQYQDQLMILSDQTQYDLQQLTSRIEFPEKCIQKGISLKFGALLEGGLTHK